MAQFGITQVASAPVRAENSDRAEIVTQLLFGEAVEIIELDSPWLKIRCIHDKYEGYMDTKQLVHLDQSQYEGWMNQEKTRLLNRSIQISSVDGPEWIYQGSLLPANYSSGFMLGDKKYNVLATPFELSRNASIIEIAQSYLNTPYLWGGRSVTGIDCSGYTQIVFAMFNKAIPRDASQQVLEGNEVHFNDIQAGDLAFFHNSTGKVIHVGILTGMGTILHASGKLREDKFDEKGIYRIDVAKHTHDLTCIRRYF